MIHTKGFAMTVVLAALTLIALTPSLASAATCAAVLKPYADWLSQSSTTGYTAVTFAVASMAEEEASSDYFANRVLYIEGFFEPGYFGWLTGDAERFDNYDRFLDGDPFKGPAKTGWVLSISGAQNKAYLTKGGVSVALALDCSHAGLILGKIQPYTFPRALYLISLKKHFYTFPEGPK